MHHSLHSPYAKAQHLCCACGSGCSTPALAFPSPLPYDAVSFKSTFGANSDWSRILQFLKCILNFKTITLILTLLLCSCFFLMLWFYLNDFLKHLKGWAWPPLTFQLNSSLFSYPQHKPSLLTSDCSGWLFHITVNFPYRNPLSGTNSYEEIWKNQKRWQGSEDCLIRWHSVHSLKLLFNKDF